MNRVLLTLLAASIGSAFAEPELLLLPPSVSTPQPTSTWQVVWSTEPGTRYELQESTNLTSWITVPGFPAASTGLAQANSVQIQQQLLHRKYYRVATLDEQAPVIVRRYPEVNAIAIPRFSDFAFTLADATGVDPSSLQLRINNGAPIYVTAPGASFTNDTFSVDLGADPIGAYGSTNTVTLIAADLLGHSTTNTWAFRLELEPLVNGDIFVFGSVPAQLSGQAVSGPAAEYAAQAAGDGAPLLAGIPATSWFISSVTSNEVVIAYTGGPAPVFANGQLICNQSPASEEEIFYRRVLSISNDPATSKLTLATEDAALGDFITRGAASFSAESVIYQVDGTGTLVLPGSLHSSSSLLQSAPLVLDRSFPRTGIDLSGARIKLGTAGDFEATVSGVTYSRGTSQAWLDMTATELSWWFTPHLHLALEMDFGGLKSFEAIASGDISLNQAFQADITALGLSTKTTIWQLAGPLRPRYVVLIGVIGVPPLAIPVYAELVFDFKIETEAKAEAVLDLSFGYRQDISANFGLTYDDSSGLDWKTGFQASSPDLSGDANFAGKFSLGVTLVPTLNVLVYGCAGFAASIEPHAGIEVKAGTGGFAGKVLAGVDLAIAPAGVLLEPLVPDDWKLSFPIWDGEWPLTPETLAFTTHPQSKTVAPGASASFTCTVDSSSPPSFQWFHNGLLVPGQNGRTLFLPSVSSGYAGSYFVRATVGSATADSSAATLTVQTTTPSNLDSDGDGIPEIYETNTGVWVRATDTGTNPFKWDTDGDGLSDGVETHTGLFVSRSNTGTDPLKPDTDGDGLNDKAEIDLGTDPNAPPVPAGFALIPAGSFQIGDTLDGLSDALPVHSVFVSAFYMQTTETTKAQWDDVRAWGLNNGYTDLPEGLGKAANHPVVGIDWYSSVKWCNARSQKEGVAPCYTVSGDIYRTGYSEPTCNFGAGGYRLPTEAEWEKAARGGHSSLRFPWGNTISHSEANYFSSTSYAYDTSPTRGYHPTYNDGTTPYTSPVGSFASNGYGLYDMSGNVYEWCWDWYSGSYYSAAGNSSDPVGPATGTGRSLRGGSWFALRGLAFFARCAQRFGSSPDFGGHHYGFRSVR